MSRKRSFILLLVFILSISLAAAVPIAHGDGPNDFTPPEKQDLLYPNLGSHLNELVASVEESGTSAEEAAKEALIHSGGSVAVTVYLSSNVDDVVQFLGDNGGDPRNVGVDYIEAYVPVTLLGQLSERPGVIRVREIIPPEPEYGPIASQGVQTHLAQAWHQAGYSGQGIKVGVIDSFEGIRRLMGTELPTTVVGRCYTDIGQYSSNLAACDSDSSHGTGVAEAIVDIAPDVSLYIANPVSLADLQSAADWMVSQGVSVINRSASYPWFDGPGDGTSHYRLSELNTINRAVGGQTVWVNSAGNYATQTWFEDSPVIHTVSSSTSNVDFVAFDGSNDISNEIVGPGGNVRVILRWDDTWRGASSDLDLLLWDTVAQTYVARSEEFQTGQSGQIPLETVDHELVKGRLYQIYVIHRSGSLPDWIQAMVRGTAIIQHYTKEGSINNPSESANGGMLAVGATHYWDTNTIADYSSQGPTPDGRVKPDIVGTACAETASYEPEPPEFHDGNDCWFPGTSQAAPHVAGLAVLVRQKFPDYTPQEVAQFLKDNAEERGDPGVDNTWGSGFALMPPLETEPGAPAIGSVSPGQQSLTVSWTAPEDEGGATITAYDLRHIRSDAPDKAEANWTVVAPAWTSGSLEYTITGLEDDTQYDVQVRAVNSVGSGPWSGSATGITEALPTDECGETLTGDGTVSGTWSAGCDSAVAERGHARYYSFTLATGGEVTITLESTDADTYLYLREDEARSGVFLYENDDDGGTSRSTISETLTAGTYTIEATTFGAGETGSFTLTISGLGDATPAPGPDPGTDECGTTLPSDDPTVVEYVFPNEQWASGCESEERSGCYARFYSFTLGQESEVTITLESTDADTYLYLREGEARSGAFLYENDDDGGTSRSTISETLTAGTYTIEATTFGAGETGSFTLTVSGLGDATPAPGPDPGTDECGETLTGDGTVSGTWSVGCDSAVAERGHARYYNFTLATGGEVTITLESTDADTYLYLREGEARSGAFLYENDDDGGTSRSTISETLTAGTYTIEATTFGAGETGSFTLTVSGLGDATPAPGPDPGTDECGTTLPSDDPTVVEYVFPNEQWASGCESEERSGSYARFYSFTLGQESEVTITLESTDADTYLYLREGEARSGAFLYENDDDGGTSRSTISETLTAGTYTIEATTFGAGETGSFTLTVSGLGDATPAPGPDPGTDECGTTLPSDDPTVVEYVFPNEQWASGCESEERSGSYARFYSFTLATGGEVTITLESTDADTYLYLREGEARSGAFLYENDDDGGTSRSTISEILAAGTYTIEATTFGAGETGSFTLTVSGLGDATPAPGPDPGTDECGTTLPSDDPTVVEYVFPNEQWASGCESEERSGSYARFYSFTLGQESEVTIALESTDADTYLYLREGEARSGTALYENDDHDNAGLASSSDSQIQATLAAGTYTIEATTFGAGETGSFTLTISGLGDTTPAPGPDPGDPFAVERAALVAFYNASGGPNWANSTGWLSEAPVGQWFGVNVNLGGFVEGIVLPDNGLVGSLDAIGTALRPLNGLNVVDLGAASYNCAAAVCTPDSPTGNRLTGQMSFEWFRLGLLEVIDLAGNPLNASLLDHSSINFWDQMTRLQRLDLSGTGTTGTIPSGMGALGELQVLVLSDNALIGPIPHSYGNLVSLRHLSLDKNQLSGPIPVALAGLSHLATLRLGGNDFTGCLPPSLRNVTDTDVGTLGLEDCTVDNSDAVDRAALVALYNATGGSSWTRQDNWLSGAPISEWEGVRVNDGGRVTDLFLPGNNLTGELPLDIGLLSRLQALEVPGNSLSGELPATMGILTELNSFSHAGNQFSGCYPRGHYPNDHYPNRIHPFIERCERSRFEQPGTAEGDRAALVAFYHATGGSNWADDTGWLTDQPMDQWHGIQTVGGRVTDIDLKDNSLTGTLPTELGNLGALTAFEVGTSSYRCNRDGCTPSSADGNRISGPIPDSMRKLKSLSELNLSANPLTGEIPAWLGELPRLTEIGLGGLRLTGSIPDEWAGLNILSVDVRNNRIEGSLPAWLGVMSGLRSISAGSNDLSGILPVALTRLTNLRQLYLFNAGLSGTLPPELGRMTALDHLDLGHNNFTGSIPTELGNLSNLSMLHLSGNDLTGCVPDSLRNVEFNDFDRLGLPFCGP